MGSKNLCFQTMSKESLFLSFIRYTFKKWIGFQDAIEEGMGGPYAREKEDWLCTEVEKYFKSYNDVSPDDLEDYLGTMIDNEFDVNFEDGSLLETCKLFCHAYNLSLTNPDDPLFQVLKNLEPPNIQVKETKQCNQSEETMSEDTMTMTSEMKNLNLTVNDPEEESWTVVTRKGHRK